MTLRQLLLRPACPRQTVGLVLALAAIYVLSGQRQARAQDHDQDHDQSHSTAAAHAPADHSKAHAPIINLRVESVLAANTAEGMDPRLAATAMKLRGLFEYTTYRLVRREEAHTPCGRVVAFNLPGGRYLHIVPRSLENDMIAMELVLFQGPRPIMSADVKLMNGASLILGGAHYSEGMLITLIDASSGDISSEHAPKPEGAPNRVNAHDAAADASSPAAAPAPSPAADQPPPDLPAPDQPAPDLPAAAGGPQ